MPLHRTDIVILLFIAGLALLRLIAIGFSPLGLDVEEAQYWQWSTTPDLGYFTKPPMIAWFIGLSTTIFGQTEFGVRALAPVLQALMAILMMMMGRSTGQAATGRWAAVLWMTTPISAIGGFIMSTDSPMLLFYLSATLMLCPLAKGERLTLLQSIVAGVMIGLAILSKYAAIYLLAGLVIWWIWHGRLVIPLAKTRQGWGSIFGFFLAMIIAMLPNLIWNLNHGFVTAKHLGDNANLAQTELSLVRPIEFLISQMGVAGPVIAILAFWALWRLRQDPIGKFWIALSIPALFLVTIQAIRNDANANWAVASWPPLIILLSLMITKYGQKLRAITGIGLNSVLAAIILFGTFAGSFGVFTPSSDPLRRMRGWDQHYQDLSQFTARHHAEAIITTRRGHIAKMIWHHRHNPITIELVDRNDIAQNHFEQRFRWTPRAGRNIILINEEALPPSLEQIQWLGKSESSKHKISKKRDRELQFHLGVEK